MKMRFKKGEYYLINWNNRERIGKYLSHCDITNQETFLIVAKTKFSGTYDIKIGTTCSYDDRRVVKHVPKDMLVIEKLRMGEQK
jgi:hypothetical protein